MSRGIRTAVFLVGAAGLAAWLWIGLAKLPGFGHNHHPYRDLAVAAALSRATGNVVASVNFDQRALDTLVEETILLASVTGVMTLALGADGFVVIGLVGLLVDGVFLRNLLPTGTLGNLFSGGSVVLLNVAVGVEVACGMRRGQWQLAGLYLLVALALAGLPPFGTALGKSLCEEAIGSGWASALFLLASAATGGAVLRAGVRCFTRWGGRRGAIRRHVAGQQRRGGAGHGPAPDAAEHVPPGRRPAAGLPGGRGGTRTCSGRRCRRTTIRRHRRECRRCSGTDGTRPGDRRGAQLVGEWGEPGRHRCADRRLPGDPGVCGEPTTARRRDDGCRRWSDRLSRRCNRLTPAMSATTLPGCSPL